MGVWILSLCSVCLPNCCEFWRGDSQQFRSDRGNFIAQPLKVRSLWSNEYVRNRFARPNSDRIFIDRMGNRIMSIEFRSYLSASFGGAPILLVLPQPSFKNLNRWQEVVALDHQQVDVIDVLAASETVS